MSGFIPEKHWRRWSTGFLVFPEEGWLACWISAMSARGWTLERANAFVQWVEKPAPTEDTFNYMVTKALEYEAIK